MSHLCHSLPSGPSDVPLSILIPTYNGRAHLERCLPSVCRHAPPHTQIVVVDDASTDGTASWLRTCFPQVEVVVRASNQGYCAAVNEGLEHVRGEVVELLNNDTEVCAGWADASLRWFADETVGSVAPLVLRMDRPGIIDSAGISYHVCGWACNRGYGRPLQETDMRCCEVFGASASAGFYRRAALTAVGGMRPEFDAYLDDVDLAFRLRWAGYRSICEPAARVFHCGHGTYGADSDRVVRLVARNEELVFWMNMPLPALVLGLAPYLGFQMVRLAHQAWPAGWRRTFAASSKRWHSWRQIGRRRRELGRCSPGTPNRQTWPCPRAPVFWDAASPGYAGGNAGRARPALAALFQVKLQLELLLPLQARLRTHG